MPEASANDVLQTLDNLNAGAHIALAVSGGGDSMGMLALAAEASQSSQAPQFSVLTVDHGLRAAAADEAKIVADVCADLGLPHVILRADEKLGAGDVQQKARRMRYRLMAEWCAAHAAVLMTAHHMQDQAETLLMRLARGSGIDGLSGMAVRQVLHTSAGALRIIRPFLKTPQAALRAAAQAADLPISDDPSNRDMQFERVRWRQLMPQMAELGVDGARLAALAETMRHTRETLNRRLHGWMEAHAAWHEYGVLRLPRADFAALPEAYQSRLLAGYVQYFGGHAHPLKSRKIENLRAQIAAKPHGAATVGGILARWRGDAVFLGRELSACRGVAVAGDRLVWDRRFDMMVAASQETKQIAPIGWQGVQHLRDAGFSFDGALPAAFYAALPGVFSQGLLLACPPIDGKAAFHALDVSQDGFNRDILGLGW